MLPLMLTNDLNLREPLFKALERDDYSKGDSDFSVTELIKPPRIAELQRRHKADIVEDASDKIFTLFGKAIHTILEKAASERYLVEQRFFTEFEAAKVSCEIDLFDKELLALQDWKITSRWTVADGAREEWIAQGNLAKYLMWKNGHEVKSIQFVAIFRDWSKIQATLKKDYPPRQVEVLEIPQWSRAETEAFLSERIAMHRAAKLGPELPLCTARERWARPTKWALMKKGRKTAIKLYDTEDQANAALNNSGDNHFVEVRPGSSVRCQHYCQVLPYCRQGQEIVRLECGF